MTAEEPRPLYLVQGGSPAARALAAALDDPEARASMTAAFADMGRLVAAFLDELSRALTPTVEALAALNLQLREAGVLPEEPPEDPRARALWLRQHRGSGPGRQLQHEHRPRRVG